jgi:hypothetical protein
MKNREFCRDFISSTLLSTGVEDQHGVAASGNGDVR